MRSAKDSGRTASLQLLWGLKNMSSRLAEDITLTSYSNKKSESRDSPIRSY